MTEVIVGIVKARTRMEGEQSTQNLVLEGKQEKEEEEEEEEEEEQEEEEE